jgi:hypothetical protein
MKKTFTIKLDTEITIDFATCGLSDAEQRGGDKTKKMIVNYFLEECGTEEFEVTQKNGSSLFEAIAQVVKAENDYFLMHKKNFNAIV